jgi:hypothetical protein
MMMRAVVFLLPAGRQSLTSPDGGDDRKCVSRDFTRIAGLIAGQDVPPIPSRFYAVRSPRAGNTLDLVGDVPIPVLPQPHIE